MNTKVMILALVLSASTCLLTAQDGNPPRDGQRPPPREGGPGDERGEDRPGPTEPLTDAQKAQVKAILCNRPASTQSLPKNVEGVGTLGNNSVTGRTAYAPPHSKGPGAKTYVYTLYALSAPVRLDVTPAQVSREVLLAAMKESVLATAELRVVYSRPEGVTGQPPSQGQQARN